MKTLTKFAFTATLGLAITLTLSCSGGDDGGGGNPSSDSGGGISSSGGGGDGGGSFTENSQVYKRNDGTPYTGSGVIKIDLGETQIDAGSVTNGIVNLQLPATIPDEYLKDFRWFCTDYNDINELKGLSMNVFVLYNSNGEIGRLRIEGEGNDIWYTYFSKAGKITCSNTKSSGKLEIININAQAGWNKLYLNGDDYENGQGQIVDEETSTNNILTKEVRWTISL